MTNLPKTLPECIVLDLDDCTWSPETYTLDQLPSKKILGEIKGFGKGCVGAWCGSEHDTLRLHPGALYLLQQTYLAKVGKSEELRWKEINIAIASSAVTVAL